jgi:hypothetical protein
LGFPNPVNEVAARTVAAGVLAMVVLALALNSPWVLIPLAYGFWARVLTGPTLSPLGRLATGVVAPRLASRARFTPGPPKRFAQAVGVAFSTSALLVWLVAGFGAARWILLPLGAAAFAEAALGFCVGCTAFGFLIGIGVIPARLCEECGDVGRRHPSLAARPTAPAGTDRPASLVDQPA